MDILKVLKGIELNEEQIAALDAFFKEHTEKIKTTLIAENAIEDKAKYVLTADAEKAFKLFEEDEKKKFDDYKKTCEKAFELFETDAEKAFEIYREEKEEEYTNRLVGAIQEVYVDIESRVKKDFLESKEYKALSSIKDLVLPLFEGEDNALVAKIKALTEEKEEAVKAFDKLRKEKVIDTLLKDIPKDYYETVRSFIESGESEDEIIHRFNSVIDIIEINESRKTEITEQTKKVFKKKPVMEEVKEEKAPLKKEVPSASFCRKTKEVAKSKNEEAMKAFTEEQIDLLQTINLA